MVETVCVRIHRVCCRRGARLFFIALLLFEIRNPTVGWTHETASYRVLPAGEWSTCEVVRLSVTRRDSEQIQGNVYQWWQLDIALTDGDTLGIRGLSERVPMTSPEGCGAFIRYLFRQRDGVVLEYTDEDAKVFLPRFSFREHLLPRPSEQSVYRDGFATSGNFLGHIAIFEGVHSEDRPVHWPDPVVIRLRPDLLIGTGRNTRDDGTPPDASGEYRYVPFQEQDYAEMLQAGVNYVGINDEQRRWTVNRPFFFRCAPEFPDDLYRSNYFGMTMFIDEPASRLREQRDPPGDGILVIPNSLTHPHQATSMLIDRVRDFYTDWNRPTRIERTLHEEGIDLGLMRIREDRIPSWETVYWTAFYQMAGGASGLVHEGRYAFEEKHWSPRLDFGLEADGRPPRISAKEMLLNYYAYLRGAARAFDGDWGTAIYGQSDPAYRDLAVTLAYDLGARFIWYWTSDHGHHLPYTEQLRLTRLILDRHQSRPRGDLHALRNAARLAIVFPYGYLPPDRGQIWKVPSLNQDCLNLYGVPYREITSAAMWEGILAAKRGEQFDFLFDHPGIRDLGYERMLVVAENGRVELTQPFDHPGESGTAMNASVRQAVPVKDAGTPECAAVSFDPETVTIDGRLDEWDGVAWLTAIEDGDANPSARYAFGLDETWLYLAASVHDERFTPPDNPWNMWQSDAVRIVLDPLRAGDEPPRGSGWGVRETSRTIDPLRMRGWSGYGEYQYVIGMASIRDASPVVWLWYAPPEHRHGKIVNSRIAVTHDDGSSTTVYETAVSLSELPLLNPSLRSLFGATCVLYDKDEDLKPHIIELSPGSREGRRSDLLETVELPKGALRKSSATVLWLATVVHTGGHAQLVISTVGGGAESEGHAQIDLEPLPPLHGKGESNSVTLPFSDVPQNHPVDIEISAPPGRYRMTVRVSQEDKTPICIETRTIYVY